jgi:type I restriction enzyme M protein
LHGKVKVFANTDFGYHRITVERPLKLRFEVTDDTLTAVAASKTLAKHVDTAGLADAIKPLLGTSWATKDETFTAMRLAMKDAGLPWPGKAPFTAALREAIGVRDPDGEVQVVKGETEPDPDLRDYENVPLLEDVEEYLQREVLPHVPDAWIDHTKTKTGYEIPFTRYFYVYKAPRPLAEIDAELKALESEIQHLLTEVTA